MKHHGSLVACVLAASLVAPGALAGVEVTAATPMHATMTMSASTAECSNNPGPFISLEGTITLGGVDAQLRFSNNTRRTHERTEDIFATATLVSSDPIHFAKQPSQGGVGGNPYIWLQLEDCATGDALGSPVFLGRCVQGLAMVSLDFIVDALATATVTSGGCENNPGPFITLEGELSLGGVCGTVIFTNNARFTHVHEEDVTVGLTLIPEGQQIRFAKQPPEGGVGGNPHIFLQFLTGDGDPIGDEIALGRCVQLD